MLFTWVLMNDGAPAERVNQRKGVTGLLARRHRFVE
jgi:hypothetical protein